MKKSLSCLNAIDIVIFSGLDTCYAVWFWTAPIPTLAAVPAATITYGFLYGVTCKVKWSLREPPAICVSCVSKDDFRPTAVISSRHDNKTGNGYQRMRHAMLTWRLMLPCWHS